MTAAISEKLFSYDDDSDHRFTLTVTNDVGSITLTIEPVEDHIIMTIDEWCALCSAANRNAHFVVATPVSDGGGAS